MAEYMLLKVIENRYNYKLKDLLDSDIKFSETYIHQHHDVNEILKVDDELLLYKDNIDLNLYGFEYEVRTINLKENFKHICKERHTVSIMLGVNEIMLNKDEYTIYDFKDYSDVVIMPSIRMMKRIMNDLNTTYYTVDNFLKNIFLPNVKIYVKTYIHMVNGVTEYREQILTPIIGKHSNLMVGMNLYTKLNKYTVKNI